MLALAEDDEFGSTPNLFLQIYKKMAAERNVTSPTSPSTAGTCMISYVVAANCHKMAPSQILRCFLCFQKALMAEIIVFKLLMTDCVNFSRV